MSATAARKLLVSFHYRARLPIKSNATGPNLMSDLPVLGGIPGRRRLREVKAHALSNPHRQTRRHPCLLLVIGAVEVSIHQHQTLYQLKCSRLPKNRLRTEERPRASEKAIPLFVSSLQGNRFLPLYCQPKNDIEYAKPDVAVCAEQCARS